MFPRKESNGYYYAYYKDLKTGKRNKKSLGTKNSNMAAKRYTLFAQEYEKQKECGIESISILEFIGIFVNYKKNQIGKEALQYYQFELKEFGKFLNKNLNAIQQDDIDNYSNHLFGKGYSVVTIKRKLSMLLTAFRHAKKHKYIPKETDLEIPPIKTVITARQFLNETELYKLMDNTSNQNLKDIVFVGYMTGMRLGEIINVRWSQVDLERGYFYLDNRTHITKNKKPRAVPMNGGTIKVVKRLLFNKGESDYVFTNANNGGGKWLHSSLGRAFRILAKKTFGDKSEHTFHCLRHSFATNLLDQGVPITRVQEMLDHANLATTQKYLHLRPQGGHEAVRRIDIRNIDLIQEN